VSNDVLGLSHSVTLKGYGRKWALPISRWRSPGGAEVNYKKLSQSGWWLLCNVKWAPSEYKLQVILL
jgi:hypothetical protein